MALSKQNRVIGTVAIFFLFATGILFSKYEKNESKAESEAFSVEKVELRDEIPVEVKRDQSEKFEEVLREINSCLKMQLKPQIPKTENLLNQLLAALAQELNEPTLQVDRWNSWRLLMPDGNEKEYRLEVVESDDGKVRRELYAFVFDQGGQLIPTELDGELALNPKIEQLSALLNEGQVIVKGKAGSNVYSGGERLDFVESNNELKEIEVSKFNQLLKCELIEMRKSCQCLN